VRFCEDPESSSSEHDFLSWSFVGIVRGPDYDSVVLFQDYGFVASRFSQGSSTELCSLLLKRHESDGKSSAILIEVPFGLLL